MTIKVDREDKPHGIEIVLSDDSREIDRMTVFEFEKFIENCRILDRSIRADMAKKARLNNLPLRK